MHKREINSQTHTDLPAVPAETWSLTECSVTRLALVISVERLYALTVATAAQSIDSLLSNAIDLPSGQNQRAGQTGF